MTSRSLFFNLQKEDMKRRIWSLALYSLFFFLCLPIVAALQLSNQGSSANDSYVISSLDRLLGLNFSVISSFTMVLAVISGLSSFFYLHSKKKIDFYHSLPIRRELQFGVNFLNGILVYIVPYVINTVFCYILIAANGYLTSSLFLKSLGAIGINLLYYILIYLIVVIAAILTGNIVVAFLGSSVFLSYGLIMLGIREIIISNYYITFSRHNDVHPIIRILSPLYNYTSVFYKGELWISALKLLLAILLLLGLALFFFVKRPSEAAGKAMAFHISKPIIKIGFIVPLSILGGSLFGSISNGNQLEWKIFGVVFVGIIGSIIFEIIYHFDIRAAFSRKREILVSLVIGLAFGALFESGMIAPDERIPQYNKIENISISIDSFETNINYHPVMMLNSNSPDVYLRSSGNYQLENMKLSDTKLLYEFAELGVHYVKDYYNYYVDMVGFTLKFTMKNGAESYRSFRVPKKKLYDRMEKLYAMPEYKEAHYPILKLDDKEVKALDILHPVTYNRYALSKNQISTLLDALKDDLRSGTLADIRGGEVIAIIQIEVRNQHSDYYIYDSYRNTKYVLDTIGYRDTYSINHMDYIQKAELLYMDYDNYENEKLGIDNNGDQKVVLTKDQLMQLRDHLIVDEYYWNNRSIHAELNNYRVELSYMDPQQGAYIIHYTIKESGEALVKQIMNHK